VTVNLKEVDYGKSFSVIVALDIQISGCKGQVKKLLNQRPLYLQVNFPEINSIINLIVISNKTKFMNNVDATSHQVKQIPCSSKD
jgi:hypothetical protein